MFLVRVNTRAMVHDRLVCGGFSPVSLSPCRDPVLAYRSRSLSGTAVRQTLSDVTIGLCLCLSDITIGRCPIRIQHALFSSDTRHGPTVKSKSAPKATDRIRQCRTTVPDSWIWGLESLRAPRVPPGAVSPACVILTTMRCHG